MGIEGNIGKKRRKLSFGTKTEGNRPPGGQTRKWKVIKMELRKKKWDGVEWINLAQYMDTWRELVNAVLKIPLP